MAQLLLCVALEKQRRCERICGARGAICKATAIDPRVGERIETGICCMRKGELARLVASLQKAVLEYTALRMRRTAAGAGLTGDGRDGREGAERVGALTDEVCEERRKRRMEWERRELGQFVVTGKP